MVLFFFDDSEFGKERERVENRTEFLMCRQGQQMDRAYDGYIKWIGKAEDVMIDEEDEEDDEEESARCK